MLDFANEETRPCLNNDRSKKILIPSAGPKSWQQYLADPAKQWVTGYSARTLAHCWEAADGLPPEIAALFDSPAELLLAIPEHKVPLPGGQRESQNDVFALIRSPGRTHAVAIEGKVREAFGPAVSEWFSNPSAGKRQRMKALCELLGFAEIPPPHIRYQLMHRTASAIIEARRFKTDEAAMIVHSFAPDRVWFDDYAAFCDLFGLQVEPDRPAVVSLPDGMLLRLGWATGEARFLQM